MKGTLHREKYRNRPDEKEKTIATLQLQLQAQTSRTSHLQSRLTLALDTIESLRLRHSQEMSEEKQARERLKMKLDRLIEFTAHVEAERDETRESVMAVLDTEPVTDDDSILNNRPLKATLHPDHSPAIVAYLRSELEKERASHARTHDQAELEILTLRAQLARREAELEAHTVRSLDERVSLVPDESIQGRITAKSTSSDPHFRPEPTNLPKDRQTAPVPNFTPEAATRLLGLTATKNKRLEAEIKELSSRLQKARDQDIAKRSNMAVASEETVQPRADEVETIGGLEDDNDTVVNPLPVVQEPQTPPSPALRPVASLTIPSPFMMTPGVPSTPLQLPKTLYAASTLSEAIPSSWVPRSSSAHDLGISQLQGQIELLGTQIDEFKSERLKLSELLEGEQKARLASAREPASSPDVTISSNDALESDTVRALREELDLTKRKAAEREQELLAKICALQDHVTPMESSLSSDSFMIEPADTSAWQNLALIIPTLRDEDEDDILSMELATPIEPDYIGPGVDLRSAVDVAVPGHGAYQELDPSLVPLPGSPPSVDADPLPPPASRTPAIHERPPTPYSSTKLSRLAAHPLGEQDDDDALRVLEEKLQLLEQELEASRKDVSIRDASLVRLQLIIAEVRVQISKLTRRTREETSDLDFSILLL